jgi:hypothetical protein
MKKKSLTGSGIERMGKEFDYFFSGEVVCVI